MSNKIVTIHALQTQPLGCMNRGETGEVKTMPMGGVTRFYVSSQCWKKAMRDWVRDNYTEDEMLFGIRTRDVTNISNILKGVYGYTLDQAKDAIESVFSASKPRKIGLGKLEVKDDRLALKTTVAFAKGSQEKIANIIGKSGLSPEDFTAKKLDIVKEAKKASCINAVYDILKREVSFDVQLFGRMIADNPDLNVDGASSIAVAHSVSEASITQDFFTAVDEMKGVSGSAMMGVKEMTSGILYRYGQLDTQILERNGMTKEDIAKTAKMFVDAFVNSVPAGMTKTYATQTTPYFVYVTVRDDKGDNASSAFLMPVKDEDQTEDFVQKTLEKYIVKRYETTIKEPVDAFVSGDSDLSNVVHLTKLGDAVCQYLSCNV